MNVLEHYARPWLDTRGDFVSDVIDAVADDGARFPMEGDRPFSAPWRREDAHQHTTRFVFNSKRVKRLCQRLTRVLQGWHAGARVALVQRPDRSELIDISVGERRVEVPIYISARAVMFCGVRTFADTDECSANVLWPIVDCFAELAGR